MYIYIYILYSRAAERRADRRPRSSSVAVIWLEIHWMKSLEDENMKTNVKTKFQPSFGRECSTGKGLARSECLTASPRVT